MKWKAATGSLVSSLLAPFRRSGVDKVTTKRDWSTEELLTRLGTPIVDSGAMIAFALADDRQIALQKDTDPHRIWVEHDPKLGFPPAVVLRKYDQPHGRHPDLPPRLGHRPGSRDRPRPVMVLNVAGPTMLRSMLSWYGAVAKPTIHEPAQTPKAIAPTTENPERGGRAQSSAENADKAQAPASPVEEKLVVERSNGPTLASLVARFGASVRLTNCVNRSPLAKMMIAEAVSNPAALEQRCRLVPGMGTKSILELQLLIQRHSVAADVGPAAAESADVPAIDEQDAATGSGADLTTVVRDRFIGLFSEIRLGEVCRALGASQRLTNAVEASSYNDLAMSELLADWNDHFRRLGEMRNFGRRSGAELRSLCGSLTEDLFKAAGIPQHDASELSSLLFEESTLPVERLAGLQNLLGNLRRFALDDLASTAIRTAEELADELLRDLDERSRDVICKRYGLDGTEKRTLEDIALDYGVTRQRVQQIESKAFVKMRTAARFHPVLRSLEESARTIWSRLEDGKGYVTQHGCESGASISPETKLLMDIAERSLSELFDAIAQPWGTGWCSPDVDTGLLDQMADRLELALSELPLPRPVVSLPAASGSKLSQMVIALRFGMDLYKGYVLGPVSRRSHTRTVDLHRLLGADGRPSVSRELAALFSRQHGRVPLSSRYVVSLMSRHPHLFLEGDDDRWFAVAPQQGGQERTSEAIEAEYQEESEGSDSQRLADLLQEYLRQRGPRPLSELIAYAGETVDRATSTGPTLLMHRELFTRVLPGVYGLRAALPTTEDVILHPPEILLNEKQMRLYALARRAGEPWGTYPLWIPAAEHALCAWGSGHAGEELFTSLLSVATVETWPIGESERAFWKGCAEDAGGAFHLHFLPRQETGYDLPELDRVLAACLELAERGHLNWMAANRILNRPVASHLSAGLMALLCSLDVAACVPQSHWQLPHKPGPALQTFLRELSGELHNRGVLRWQSPLGQRILADASRSIETPSYWVDRHLLAGMLQSGENLSVDGGHDNGSLIERAVTAELDGIAWEADSVPVAWDVASEAAIDSSYHAIAVGAAQIRSEDEGDWSLGDIADD